MMTLLGMRKAIKALLTSGGLWAEDEVIIRRRAPIWNEVATATEVSKRGQCLVIGTAKGDAIRGNKGSNVAVFNLTIVVTICETVSIEPGDEGEEEDERWQQTIALLQGNTLGRDPHHDTALQVDGFDEVENSSHVIRQTLFKTRFIVSAKTTPQPDPPESP